MAVRQHSRQEWGWPQVIQRPQANQRDGGSLGGESWYVLQALSPPLHTLHTITLEQSALLPSHFHHAQSVQAGGGEEKLQQKQRHQE